MNVNMIEIVVFSILGVGLAVSVFTNLATFYWIGRAVQDRKLALNQEQPERHGRGRAGQ
jgi:hypothetical protein